MGSIFFIVELILFALGSITYKAAHRWPAFCTRVLLRLWGIRVKQHNLELLKDVTQSVIVINHRSDLDALVATGYMPGQLVEKLYITVDRRSKRSRKQSLRHMKKQSNRGAHIVVFPEGWSNFSEDYLLELRRGAFKVALDLQVPILVCTMIGTHERFPKPKISLTPGEVTVYWEKIIPTKGMLFEDDAEKLKDEVRQTFIKRLEEHYPDGYRYPKGQTDFDAWIEKQMRKTKKA